MITNIPDAERALSAQIDEQGGQLVAWRDRAIAAEQASKWESDLCGQALEDRNASETKHAILVDEFEAVRKERDELREGIKRYDEMADMASAEIAVLTAELARLRKDVEFYRNFAAEVLAVKRLPMPHDMEALCRTAYENRYHKIKAEVGYDEWRLIWVRAIASHEVAPPAQPAEPVQRLSDAGIEALAGKHGTTYRNRHFPTQPAFSFSNGSLHRFVRDIESAIQPQPGWRDIESAPKESPCA